MQGGFNVPTHATQWSLIRPENTPLDPVTNWDEDQVSSKWNPDRGGEFYSENVHYPITSVTTLSLIIMQKEEFNISKRLKYHG